ncbi:MAG: chemotaxis protein CheW [Planctomycetota bacterium]|nr:MAG: chemotaxis protein CheW [Planctomycetota bacterium]
MTADDERTDAPLDELLREGEEARAADAGAAVRGAEFQIIRFLCGGKPFAVPIENVVRTERVPPVTPVPRAPSWVRGIASLRGGVVCIIDLPALLEEGDGEASTREARSLLVLGEGRRDVAVLSDSLPDFERVSAGETFVPAERHGGIYARAIEREGTLVGVLDVPRLFARLEELLVRECG